LTIAKGLNAYQIFDLKNVDGVYSADPKKDTNPKYFKQLKWDAYLDLFKEIEDHKPGANLPVDVIAAREAKEYGAEYYILSARDLNNLEAAILGHDFRGTTISNS